MKSGITRWKITPSETPMRTRTVLPSGIGTSTSSGSPRRLIDAFLLFTHRANGSTAGRHAPSALVSRVRRLRGLGGGRPAPEELECLFRARAGFGGIGEDRQPVVCREVKPVEAQAELADNGMVEVLDAGVVEADVVRGPAGA